VKLTSAMLGHAERALAQLLQFSAPADRVLSAYFRQHRTLGQTDRAFVAETCFAVLRRKRSLEAIAGTQAPRQLLLANLLRIQGLSVRALAEVAKSDEAELLPRMRAVRLEDLPPAVRLDLPDWLWERLAQRHGDAEAREIAQGLLNPAPLDLRVNLAKMSRDEALAGLAASGIAGEPTRYSPAGIRLKDKPAINRHPLFLSGCLEVQDEGSQLVSYLLAPRRGEMVADFCAGAGGKTLAMAMLMRGAGRIYAMDVSTKRLGELAPRAARAGVSNIQSIVLSDEDDLRARRLAGKLDRVLVDAPCSGFGTLRRNPDLKWRHDATAIEELANKQRRILKAAARLLHPGGRLVYATCSVLEEENDSIVAEFVAAHPNFVPLPAGELMAAQRIELDAGTQLRLWPHRHATDGFFAAAFERRPD
jgi:16S rRNA (cytosine967-C5)-methyltransferase